MRLQESKNRYSITIPKEYVLLKKWKKGQMLAIAVNQDGDLVIKEVK